jgi:hypothetical protein
MKKSLALLTFLCVLMLQQIGAQTYNTAIGVRVNDGLNVTLKNSLSKKYMLETILHTPIFNENVGVTLMLERHRKIMTRNLSLFYGGGPHAYFKRTSTMNDVSETNKNVYGLSGIGGLDLCIGRLNVSVDLMPELHIITESSKALELNGASVSVRYIIDKKERTRLRDRVKVPKWAQRDQKSKPSKRRRS